MIKASKKIVAPTIVFQGSEEPIFRPDHGEALAQAIDRTEYGLIDGQGRVLNPHFFDYLIEKLVINAQRS